MSFFRLKKILKLFFAITIRNSSLRKQKIASTWRKKGQFFKFSISSLRQCVLPSFSQAEHSIVNSFPDSHASASDVSVLPDSRWPAWTLRCFCWVYFWLFLQLRTGRGLTMKIYLSVSLLLSVLIMAYIYSVMVTFRSLAILPSTGGPYLL